MAFELVGKIAAVAATVYDHVQLVKANKARCQRLAERIEIIVTALQGLDQLSESRQFRKGLEDLLGLVQEVSQFVQKFGGQRWFKRTVKAKSHREEFEQFNVRLEQSMSMLQLGLNAQQIMNREHDREDLAADTQDIQNRMGEILTLNQEEYQKMELFRTNQQEQQEIMLRMMESLRLEIGRMQVTPTMSERSIIEEHFCIPYHELDFVQLSKEGENAKIYQGRWHDERVVIKLFQGALTEEQQKLFIHEIQVMSQIRNRSIVQFYGACLEQGKAGLIMEPMAHGSLYDALGDEVLRLELREPAIQRRLAIEVGRGLLYLHQKRIVHCNLHSRHILLNKENHAKITDFGLAKMDKSCIQRIQFESAFAYRDRRIEIRAPELMRGAKPSKKSDLYNYGVILWEILSNRSMDVQHLKKINKEKMRVILLNAIPLEYREIVSSCWNPDPDMRPKLKQVIKQLKAIMVRPMSPGPEELFQQGSACLSSHDFLGARGFFARAAHKGHMRSRTTLGTLYLQGLGGDVDKERAYRLILESAQAGHERAQFNLAMMFENGDGTDRNLEQALFWYQKAAEQGNEKARAAVERLKPQNMSYALISDGH